MKKIDQFKELTERVQHQVVAEFDEALVALSDKSSIPFESLKPDFTEDTFKQIKEKTKSKAYLDELKNDLIANLEDFVENIRTKYIAELANNARGKKNELDAIMEAKATAEQIRDIIQELSAKADRIASVRAEANKIKGGISKYVQHNN